MRFPVLTRLIDTPPRRRNQEKREAQLKKLEDEKAKLDEASTAAALRQFGTGQVHLCSGPFGGPLFCILGETPVLGEASTAAALRQFGTGQVLCCFDPFAADLLHCG